MNGVFAHIRGGGETGVARKATQSRKDFPRDWWRDVNYLCLKAGASGIGREDSREASIERDCA